MTKNLFAGAEFAWRDLDEPTLDFEGNTEFVDRDEQLYRVYLYWALLSQVALSVDFNYDRYDADEGIVTEFGNLPERVETLSIPLAIRYFHPRGFFAGAGVTYVDQEVRRSATATLTDGSDDFAVVDAMVGYRFPRRFGIASLEVNNLLGTSFNYQDDSFREFRDEPSISRYIPERTIMGRIAISF